MDLNLSCLVLDHFPYLATAIDVGVEDTQDVLELGRDNERLPVPPPGPEGKHASKKNAGCPSRGDMAEREMAETHIHARATGTERADTKTTRRRGRVDRFRHKIITPNTSGSSPRLPASKHARMVALTERRRQAKGRFCVWVLVAFCTKPGNPRCGPSLGDTTRHVFSHPRATASTADIGTA